MSSLPQLKLIRRGLKGSITKAETSINSSDPQTITRGAFQIMQRKVTDCQAALEHNHDQIIQLLTDDDELNAQSDEQGDQIERCTILLLRLAELEDIILLKEEMWKREEARKDEAAKLLAQAQAQQAHPSPTPPVNTPVPTCKVKLPDLQVPKFSGKLEDWILFRNRFKHAVDSRTDLTDAVKLQYLLSYLEGPPAQMLSAVNLDDRSYQPSWKQLQGTFEHRRELTLRYIYNILDIPNLSERQATKLRSMLNVVQCSLDALTSLGETPDAYSSMIVAIILQRLDKETRQRFLHTLPDTSMPTWTRLQLFLNKECADLLTTAGVEEPKTKKPQSQQPSQAKPFTPSCSICKGAHLTFKCSQLECATDNDKKSIINKSKLCTNCLKSGHSWKECRSPFTCQQCKQKHHTILHNALTKSQVPEKKTAALTCKRESTVALKPTALVHVIRDKEEVKVRTMVDNCADEVFISQALVTKLGLVKERLAEPFDIAAAGDVGIGTATEMVEFQIHSTLNSNYSYDITAFVLPRIGGPYPSQPFSQHNFPHLPTKGLADPWWAEPGQVDLLLSNHIYYKIIKGTIIRGGEDEPIAQQSTLGWLVGGGKNTVPKRKAEVYSLSKCTLNQEMQRFWELEQATQVNMVLTKEEREAEEHYKATTVRRPDGSYEVSLPFKEQREPLGDSKAIAFKRFLSLETKLQRNPELGDAYKKAMRELQEEGHMEPIPSHQLKSLNGTYYLPHHAVVKEASSTTKLRIVFDASARTTASQSLNEQLLVGPRIQQDLFAILVRWRYWLIPLSADIRKMYLCIWTSSSDRDYQRLFWREKPTDQLRQFRLNKVTFGEASAPFQAIRTLHQLAEDYGTMFPEASRVLKEDFYVDDCLTGRNHVEDALTLQSQLMELTAKGKFMLRKWASSEPRILEAVPDEFREVNFPFSLDRDEFIKALGMVWNYREDNFTFQVQPVTGTKDTKRSILSTIARVFDPLGLLSPVTIRAKMVMQGLWKEETSWDEEPSTAALKEWKLYQEELQGLSNLKIPRCINSSATAQYQLHGFSDASEKAYAAAVYLRCQNEANVQVTLIAAKTRVAPTKPESLPRLELCAALLLSELMVTISKALPIHLQAWTAWSDSTVTLSWIKSDPNRWRTFERNRVAKIQDQVPPSSWRHIPGTNNPADLPSRGMKVEDFLNSKLWWNGPSFLQDPTMEENCTDEVGFKPIPAPVSVLVAAVVSREDAVMDILAQRHSCWYKLKWRTAVWVMLWCQKQHPTATDFPKATELEDAERRWIRYVQKQAFGIEIQAMVKGKPVPSNSKLKSLCPFIQHELIMVGGRLRNAEVPTEQKHPVVLPPHHITELIIRWYHITFHHAGLQLLMSLLQRKFWILRGKAQVKKIIRSCKTCRIHRSATAVQLMADLPKARVTPGRPFTHVGIDYAGPFQIRDSCINRRKAPMVKAYAAIFICFSTKAVHLEVVSSLSTESFLAALDRFVARRGVPSVIQSDNGTNFVGAKKELREVLQQRPENFDGEVNQAAAKRGIKWILNPPAAPHMGGIWEAAVKSMKFHLRRVLGEATTNFEELDTLLKGIEACLNSRPICPERTDPNDLSAITPGHFLIGEPLVAVPDHDLTQLKQNTLSRWQRIQQMRRHFWNRWKDEYLCQLQRRVKWMKPQPNLKTGDLVVIKEENLPPQNWRLGRVIEAHVDPTDGKALVRAVTVRTANGIFKRPIHKLVLLPGSEMECEEGTSECLN